MRAYTLMYTKGKKKRYMIFNNFACAHKKREREREREGERERERERGREREREREKERFISQYVQLKYKSSILQIYNKKFLKLQKIIIINLRKIIIFLLILIFFNVR